MFFQDKKALEQCNRHLGVSQALVDAIEKNVATISFTPQGEIIAANQLFLSLMGFEPGDIIGRHHRMLCASDYANSAKYSEFWQALRNRSSQKGRFFTAD